MGFLLTKNKINGGIMGFLSTRTLPMVGEKDGVYCRIGEDIHITSDDKEQITILMYYDQASRNRGEQYMSFFTVRIDPQFTGANNKKHARYKGLKEIPGFENIEDDGIYV